MNLHEQISRISEIMNLISESEYFTELMKVGKTSDEVEKLQELLNMEEPSGSFDDETDECVREFQEFAEIKVDGIVGPETRSKLRDLIDGNLTGWLGCKKTIKVKDEKQLENKPSVVGSAGIVGSGWKSCKAWFGNGSNKYGDKFKVSKTSSEFKISYKGPSSGLSIAHAAGGGDTIHQVYNVLICEINPFLAQGGIKPNIGGINITGGGSGKNSTITISVPLSSDKGVWQLDRRGGWNHNPGPSKMASKCRKLNKEGKECIGPVTKVITGPFGTITEHFITHQI
jgi:hypothetical protein